MPEIVLTDREARILIASAVIALDWFAVFEARARRCWSCGAEASQVGRLLVVAGTYPEQTTFAPLCDAITCEDCRRTFIR